MPTSCVACGCANKGRGKKEGITYHNFPRDDNAKQKWINAIKRKDWQPKKHSRICSAHFREKDIDRTALCRVRIRDGAVPSIFKAFPEDSQPPKGAQLSAAAGSSKRQVSECGEWRKKQKGALAKKMKIAEDKETERVDPEDCLQDPFDIIDIEETRIKEEIFETEEFNEIKQEENLLEEGSTQDVNFETIYCTPSIIKDEHQDYLEMPDTYNTTETDPIVPEFVNTVIKTEPPEEDESMSEESMSQPSPPPLMWRCPLVCCPEMFSAELEMYQHLNLNHVVKGRASKKVSGPRSVVPTVISPSTTPSVAISSASGLVFFTSTSPVDVSKISVPVTTSQSVPSSSSGPVTVTTTFSYSSTTTSSAPLVTSVSGSSVSSVSSAPMILSVSPSATVGPTPTVSPSVCVTSSTIHSSNALSATTASQGLQNVIVAPINQATSSADPKKFLLLASQQPLPASATKTSQLQPQQISATKTSKSQPLHIFHPSELITEGTYPLCATDDSEMFSISLARFPQNRRVPIKQKLVDVVNCFKQKNINPEKLIIAYYENSPDSRTM